MPRMRKQSCMLRSQLAAARRSLETPEERALRLEKTRIRAAARRACESEEERAIRLARERARTNAARANLKQKARAANLQQIIRQTADCSSDQNIAGLNRTQQTAYKAYLILKSQREAAARSAAARRSQETPEQRAIRLEKSRIRAAVVRACESEDARVARLARQRIRTKAARSYLKHKARADALHQICQQTGVSTEEQSIARVAAFKQMYKQTVAANRNWERARAVHFEQIYQQHMAYQAYLLLEAQGGAAVDHSLMYSPGRQWMRSAALHTSFIENKKETSLYITGEEDEKPSLENGRISPVAGVDVECEVTIEEGSELEDIKQFNEPVEKTMYEIAFCKTSTIKQEAHVSGTVTAGISGRSCFVEAEDTAQHQNPVPSFFEHKPQDEAELLNSIQEVKTNELESIS